MTGKDTWPEWLYEDGNGTHGTVKAKNMFMALGILMPEGHYAVRDIDGEADETENHGGRHAGWFMYRVVDRSTNDVVDWIAITPKEVAHEGFRRR